MQRSALGVVVYCLLTTLSSLSQEYSIKWHAIGGGSGTSTAGDHSVTGTIGQADSSLQAMAGGPFSVTGGFWSLLSVAQTPGGPALSITLTTTNTAVVSWPLLPTGWRLQQSTNGFDSTNWISAPGTIQGNGTIQYLVVADLPAGRRFYRLFKP